jgi:hypothetical protein
MEMRHGIFAACHPADPERSKIHPRIKVLASFQFCDAPFQGSLRVLQLRSRKIGEAR